ncbi:hypothetical protein PFISCL1PPCAC_23464 [Pristionchus fissidentatus]|uniref:Protein kinase domain-containing protein n=1 Tax=Pristionchus fissidentatus TaxID=1538716 RepID=A0AAV5WJN2_9BILA|nr:hypothetical protein PFISCL1PPCAC_23464 [Pristionchus fissidentatus]
MKRGVPPGTPTTSDNDENDEWEKVTKEDLPEDPRKREEVLKYLVTTTVRQVKSAFTAPQSSPSPSFPPPPTQFAAPQISQPTSTPCNSCGMNGGPSSHNNHLTAAAASQRPVSPPTTGPVRGAPGVYTMEELSRALPSLPTGWMHPSGAANGNGIPSSAPTQTFSQGPPQQMENHHQHQQQQPQLTLQSLLSNPIYLNHSIYELQRALQNNLIMKSLGMNGVCPNMLPTDAQYNSFMEQLLEPYFGTNAAAAVIARDTEMSRQSVTPIQAITAEELAAQHQRQREALQYMQYKDLERRVLLTYGPKYLGRIPGVDPLTSYLASSPLDYAPVNSNAYAPASSEGPTSLDSSAASNPPPAPPVSPVCSPVATVHPSSSSSFTPSQSSAQPLNSTHLDRTVSEAITYAKARWPQGSPEPIILMTESEMPPSISYSQFLALRPELRSQFGEPLASFLTILSCFLQNSDERKTTSDTRKTEEDDGAVDTDRVTVGAFQWKGILGAVSTDCEIEFSEEMDVHIITVLRAAVRAIVDDRPMENGTASIPLQTHINGPQFPVENCPLPENSGLSYPEQLHAYVYEALGRGPLPPSAPFVSSQFFPPDSAPITLGLLNDTEMRNIIVGGKAEMDLSPAMSELLAAMFAAGESPPYNGNAQQLIDDLIDMQSIYGVVPLYNVPLPPSHLSMPIHPPLHSMQQPTNESPVLSIGRQNLPTYRSKNIFLPPELMYLTPNASRFKYSCCNVMVSEPTFKKTLELLELSDDEESDEAGGLHSLPVSIKREYVLGVGKFGTVYEGCVVPFGHTNPKEVDMESDDKKVAIKAIDMTYFAQYPHLKKQLDYEVSTLRQCMGFPAIVQFEGFTESSLFSPFSSVSPSQHAFIVMELMGCNLDDYVGKQESQRLPELHAKVIIRQIQAALNFLHCRGISHCDLKPANVLMYEKSWVIPQVKLTDFGHVRFYGDRMSETEIAHETAGLGVSNNRGYRAPEHATVQGYSPELDMYALGALSYFIMTGFVPNLTAPRNPSAAILQNTTNPLQKIRKGKKGKGRQEGAPVVEMNRIRIPSVAKSTRDCALHPDDERMEPEDHMYDLDKEPDLWPYSSKMSYHFCREHMKIDPQERIKLRDSMDHEWLSGFEMYSMLRRLECRMGLLKPSERHLTTVLDDVNYQRAMLYMASHPQDIQPLSSLSGGGDLSNGANELHMLYSVGHTPSHHYAPIRKTPPERPPLSAALMSLNAPQDLERDFQPNQFFVPKKKNTAVPSNQPKKKVSHK